MNQNEVVQSLQALGRRSLPAPLKAWLWKQYQAWQGSPSSGRLRLGHLRRLEPFSRDFGFDRGRPVDRHYIERFLAAHADAVQGRVLEVLNNAYTQAFGGDRVTQSDVLHAREGNPKATIIADLSSAPQIPDNSFDCIIFTQTLLFIYDVTATVATLERILKPGGVLLLTVPGITPFTLGTKSNPWDQYWTFSEVSVKTLLEEAFAPDQVRVESYGNVLSATAFLYGLADHELRPEELAAHDPHYQVIIAAHARKSLS